MEKIRLSLTLIIFFTPFVFQAVEPTNKRYLLAIDVSGSMSWGNCIGTSITPRVASAAMAMLTARTEPQYHFVGFSHHLVPLNINSTQRLDTVIRTIEQVNGDIFYCEMNENSSSRNTRNE